MPKGVKRQKWALKRISETTSKSNKPTSFCEFTKTSKKEKQAEYHGNQYESGLSQKSAEVQKPIDTQKELAKSLPQKSAEPSKSIENETREKLAKVAGVSHDTIAKVEKIEQKATSLLVCVNSHKVQKK